MLPSLALADSSSGGDAPIMLDPIVVDGTKPETPIETLFSMADDVQYALEQEREIFLSGGSTHPQIRRRMGYGSNTHLFNFTGNVTDFQMTGAGDGSHSAFATPWGFNKALHITQKWRIAIDNDDGSMYMFNPYLVKGTTFQEGSDRDAFGLIVVFPDNRLFVAISEFSSQNILVTQNPDTYQIDFAAHKRGTNLHTQGEGRSLKLSDNTFTGVLINKATSDVIHGLWNSHSGMNKAMLSITGTQTQYNFEIKGDHIWGYTKAFDHISAAH